MEVASFIEALVGARQLAEAARAEVSNANDARETQTAASLVQALRFIYFAPTGVLALLDQLAEGEYPSEDQVRLVLTPFNDYEHHVHRMIRHLNHYGDIHEGTLTLYAARVLREIANGKGGVREKTKSLLNEALTFGEPVDKDEVIVLREQILRLNSAIEEAEIALVHATR